MRGYNIDFYGDLKIILRLSLIPILISRAMIYPLLLKGDNLIVRIGFLVITVSTQKESTLK